MTKTQVRRIIGILILLVSLAILLWGLWPVASEIRMLPVSPTEMQLPQPGGLLPGFLGVL